MVIPQRLTCFQITQTSWMMTVLLFALITLGSCGGSEPQGPTAFERYSQRVYRDLQQESSTRLISGAYDVRNIQWVSMSIEKHGTQYRMVLTGDWPWHGNWSDSRTLRFQMTTLHTYGDESFGLIPTCFIEITSTEETYDVDQKATIINGMKEAMLKKITQINEQIKLENIRYPLNQTIEP